MPNGLKTLILATALVPSLLIALALGIYLSSSRLDDLHTLLRERGDATSTQLALVARRALDGADRGELQQLAALTLEEPGVRAVAFFDAARAPLVHAGPQLPALMPSALTERPQRLELDQLVRFVQPIQPAGHFTSALTGAADATPLGWVAVDYSRDPYVIRGHRSVFIGGLIIILALICTIAIAVFASRRLDRALARLRQGIQRIEAGQFDTPIHVDNQSELQVLAQDINRMAARVQQASIELQRTLEQTNRDLRESLETVEVQNIELDLARREALEASRIKSEFLTNTSHELRTPLNGIIGFTKLLLKSTPDARQREYLETIRYSAENLLSIINDILDFSKIEAGKLVLDNVPFNLRDLIEDTLAILAPSAFEKGLDLVLLYDPDVPSELVGDPLRLRQILTNLVSNGIKFTARGHVSVRVSLTGAVAPRVPLKISVSDTGIGLSDTQQKQLFKAFAQADASTSRVFGGTGLGLAISKRLVEQMGGEIALESKATQGSTFWVSLRLQAQQNPLRRRSFDQLSGRRVLLYDAQPLSQRALRQLLESWQVDVLVVEHWQELRQPAAALCDGWVVSLSHEELAAGALAELAPAGPPAWALVPSLATDYPPRHRLRVLTKPIGHVQLYDVLSAELDGSAAASPQAPAAETPLQVLAVDDNPTNLRLLAILLEERGARVSLATGGREALTLCEGQRFDLILMDIQMPELDGVEATRLIRSGDSPNRATRIVALTAHLLSEERRHLLATGFDLCLTKPITEEQLSQLLAAPRVAAADTETTAPRRPVDVALCRQRAHGKADLAADMLQGLLASLPATRGALTEPDADRAALLAVTHKLHGACCYSGTPRLQQCSRELEEQLKQHDGCPIKLAATSGELIAAIDELLEWSEHHDIAALFSDSDAAAESDAAAL